jgi:hypothetical protein
VGEKQGGLGAYFTLKGGLLIAECAP